ncbi:hypothetical protein DXG01_014646 [Tephrocybe rancida]|nr:hypothetical protein DXG01_014646 [Tephrocybe rancida]
MITSPALSLYWKPPDNTSRLYIDEKVLLDSELTWGFLDFNTLSNAKLTTILDINYASTVHLKIIDEAADVHTERNL